MVMAAVLRVNSLVLEAAVRGFLVVMPLAVVVVVVGRGLPVVLLLAMLGAMVVAGQWQHKQFLVVAQLEPQPLGRASAMAQDLVPGLYL